MNFDKFNIIINKNNDNSNRSTSSDIKKKIIVEKYTEKNVWKILNLGFKKIKKMSLLIFS